jgi:SAM-dependent methyltransferase
MTTGTSPFVSARAIIKRGRRAVWAYGYRGSARMAVCKLRQLPERLRPDRFDSEYGTDTSQVVRLEALQSVSDEQARLGHRYQASTPGRAISALERLPIRPDEFTLVDIGSGKGRVVLIAAKLPFRRIIGVEFASELHDIAVGNVRRVRPDDPRLELVCQDVTDYEFPDEPLVLYFYGPFLAPSMRIVMDRVAQSLRARPRRAYLVLFTAPDLQREAEMVGFERVDESVFAWPAHSS